MQRCTKATEVPRRLFSEAGTPHCSQMTRTRNKDIGRANGLDRKSAWARGPGLQTLLDRLIEFLGGNSAVQPDD